MGRPGLFLASVFAAALIAHPSWERPFHGPPSDDVAFVLEHKIEEAWSPSPFELEVSCRQAPAKRVYDCEVEAIDFDSLRRSLRVTAL